MLIREIEGDCRIAVRRNAERNGLDLASRRPQLVESPVDRGWTMCITKSEHYADARTFRMVQLLGACLHEQVGQAGREANRKNRSATAFMCEAAERFHLPEERIRRGDVDIGQPRCEYMGGERRVLLIHADQDDVRARDSAVPCLGAVEIDIAGFAAKARGHCPCLFKTAACQTYRGDAVFQEPLGDAAADMTVSANNQNTINGSHLLCLRWARRPRKPKA
ncbi:hypothetical protein D9M68_597920 [compost metagenome]